MPYYYLLQVGKEKVIENPKAYCNWHLPVVPSGDMDKQRVMNFFERVKVYIDNNKEKVHSFKKDDLPEVKDLKEFINEKQGQVVQIRLPDNRLAGIYPDNNKLLGKYDIEYHASTVVNMQTILTMFNANEVSLKEA